MNPHIQLNPRVCNGKPVIAGTRIPVTVILDQMIACGSIDRLLDLYPDLSREQVVGVLRYCHDLIDHTDLGTQVA
jgi:uncharacterized protein (DUF433 family)